MATVVLDNGGGIAKIGYSTFNEPRLVPNCVTKAKNVRSRIFIGDQIDDCKDLSGLYYLMPFQKGYIVNWDIEKQVWDYLFSKDVLKVNFSEADIVLTESYFNFVSNQEATNEIIFEDYQFNSMLRINPSCLSQFKSHRDASVKPLCTLVVDSGYSFTHIIPYYRNKKVKGSIRRLNVGGKILTNHLKEIISYRQLMMMDETYVVNQAKEDVCFVSTQFGKDMEIAKKRGSENTVARDYILPDYTHIKRGFARPICESTGKAKGSEQIIRMGNERFAVPEVLFHPSDIGIQEMGVAEAIIHSIQSTPEEMQPHLYTNIVLTGGNCMHPGFKERVEMDVRSMAADEYEVNVHSPKNPVAYAWEGGCSVVNAGEFKKLSVSRQDYDEYGHTICQDKFDV